MPSAAAKLSHHGSTEISDPLQKACGLLDKKIRNLEKRKNKLQQYQKDLKDGKDLNADQMQAVKAYDAVAASLDISREYASQFTSIHNEHTKMQKKQWKLEQQQRAQDNLERIKQILMVQDVFHLISQEGAKDDFLEGRKGAIKLASEKFDLLDSVYKSVTPVKEDGDSNTSFQETINSAAEHFTNLVDGKNKAFLSSTYLEVKNLISAISNCSYPEKEPKHPVQETEVVEESVEPNDVPASIPPNTKDTVSPPVNEIPTPEQLPPGLVPCSSLPDSPQQDSLVAPASRTEPSQTPFFGSQSVHSISIKELVPPSHFDFLQESQVAQDAPVFLDPAVVSIGGIKTDQTGPSSHIQSFSSPSIPPFIGTFSNSADTTPNPPPPIPLPSESKEASFQKPKDSNSWEDVAPQNTVPVKEQNWADASVNGDSTWNVDDNKGRETVDDSNVGSDSINQTDENDRKSGYGRGRGYRGSSNRGNFRGSRGNSSGNYGYQNGRGSGNGFSGSNYRGGSGNRGSFQSGGGQFRGRSNPRGNLGNRGNRGTGRGGYQQRSGAN